MKSSTPDILRRQLVPCTLLVALIALIWLGWPQLANVPSTTSRLYLTAALYLTYALKLIFVDLSPTAKPPASLNPETQKQLGILEGRLNGILRFLQKTPMMHHGIRTRFSVLPWHLVIGPKGTGKTSLLAHAGMRFVLSKKFPADTLMSLPPSTHPEWWVTRDLVLVDLPGNWSLMQGFIDLLQKKKSHSTLSSVVIALNLPELMLPANSDAKDRVTDSLRKQIEHLRNTLGHHLSFYLVITKCDLLPGFSEFFRDSSREELTSAWGITLPKKAPEERLQDVISQRFNTLIRQLNNQLVLRLHQERDIRLRPLIKDFPLELERLRDQVLQYLSLSAPDLPLRGIWLTSALQKPLESKRLEIQTTTTHLSLQSPSLDSLPQIPSKPYFIRHVIQHALPGWSGKEPKSQKQQTTLRRTVYTLSGGMLVAAAILFGRDFADGISRFRELQAGIQQYAQSRLQTPTRTSSLSNTLTLLASLQVEKEKPLITMKGLSQRLLSFYSGKAQQEATRLYREAVETVLLPALGQTLDTWLNKAKEDTSTSQLYQVLTARLMLAGKIPMVSGTFTQALIGTGAITAEEAHSDRLQAPLAVASQYQFVEPVKTETLEKTRYRLTHLPIWQLGMLLLENNQETVGATEDDHLQIPSLFTQARFTNILQHEIPSVTLDILHGNAILGTMPPQMAQKTHASIVSQIRNRYQQSYAKAWATRLRHLPITMPTDLFSADAAITDFINGTSPFFQQLKAIHDNTAFSPIQQMNPGLLAMDRLLSEDPDNTETAWHQTLTALTWLHQSLESILTATETTRASLKLVMQAIRSPENNPFIHLRQIALQQPEPLKSWLVRLTDTCWQLIVKESGVPSVSPSLMAAFEHVKGPQIPLRIHPSRKGPLPGIHNETATMQSILKKMTDEKNPVMMQESNAKPVVSQPWTLNLKLPSLPEKT